MLVKLIHPTCYNAEMRKDQGEQAGCRKKDTRGLFTAGEDTRGRGVWEDSDQLHADLRRRLQKNVCLERERDRERETVSKSDRCI